MGGCPSGSISSAKARAHTSQSTVSGARRRGGVVMIEGDARLAQALLAGHLLATKPRRLIGLVSRRVAQVVGQHDQEFGRRLII